MYRIFLTFLFGPAIMLYLDVQIHGDRWLVNTSAVGIGTLKVVSLTRLHRWQLFDAAWCFGQLSDRYFSVVGRESREGGCGQIGQCLEHIWYFSGLNFLVFFHYFLNLKGEGCPQIQRFLVIGVETSVFGVELAVCELPIEGKIDIVAKAIHFE